jgi:hypothetical protein
VGHDLSFVSAIRSLCDISGIAGSAACSDLALALLERSWPLVDKAMRAAHADELFLAARRLVEDPAVVFLVRSPQVMQKAPSAARLASTLKAFVAFDSIHAPTLLAPDWRGHNDTYLTEHIEVLAPEMIATPETLHSIFSASSLNASLGSGVQAEEVFARRFLVLRDEAPAFAASHVRYKAAVLHNDSILDSVSNDDLKAYFAPNISIDELFDRFAVPDEVYHRILASFGRIRFGEVVYETLQRIMESCPRPCLTVSVESAGYATESRPAAAEGEEDGTEAHREAVALHYRDAIAEVLQMQPGIATVLILCDDPDMLDPMKRLTVDRKVPYLFPVFGESIDPVFKAAVDLLAVASGCTLLGRRGSDLLQVAHWMGGLRRRVYFLRDVPILSSSVSASGDAKEAETLTGSSPSLQQSGRTGRHVSTVDPTVLNRVDACVSHCYSLFILGHFDAHDKYCFEGCVDSGERKSLLAMEVS